jgi:hypothetical protein
MLSVIRLSVVCFIAVSVGCATTRHLTEADVIDIAQSAAVKEGYRLEDYKQPSASYDAKDKSWWVFYDHKPPGFPGGHFSVRVYDETKEAQLFHGR